MSNEMLEGAPLIVPSTTDHPMYDAVVEACLESERWSHPDIFCLPTLLFTAVKRHFMSGPLVGRLKSL